MAWVGGAISAGGSIAGGLLGGKGSDKAAKEQAKATREAIRAEQEQFAINRGDLAPWRKAGGAAIERLSDLMGLSTRAPVGDARYDEIIGRLKATDDAAHTAQYGYSLFDPKSWYVSRGDITEKMDKGWQDAATQEFISKYGEDALQAATPKAEGYGDLLKKFTVGDFWADPVTELGFQFGLDEGRKGLERMAAARGGLNSGATLKALTRYGTDYTGTKAAESRGRFVDDQTTLYNRLAGIAGSGQTATNTTAGLGAQSAGNVANMLTAQGNARGAAAIAKSNAYGGAFGNVANTVGNYFGSNASYNPSSNYNAAGQFTPYYTGYGAAGDYQYG